MRPRWDGWIQLRQRGGKDGNCRDCCFLSCACLEVAPALRAVGGKWITAGGATAVGRLRLIRNLPFRYGGLLRFLCFTLPLPTEASLWFAVPNTLCTFCRRDWDAGFFPPSARVACARIYGRDRKDVALRNLRRHRSGIYGWSLKSSNGKRIPASGESLYSRSDVKHTGCEGHSQRW